ncbi:hypothetical protein Taro_041485 [Colocasia esculenta]|uniref:Uncharacterized protein n=1 Tax=Colocasia esculenta TaxID=4460 RepID=A0A843WLL2_COLES|nr:hypothetical protein [Colocasia esculenta]
MAPWSDGRMRSCRDVFPRLDEVVVTMRLPVTTGLLSWCLCPLRWLSPFLGTPNLIGLLREVSRLRAFSFFGASLWWHRRVWFFDLVVSPGTEVVLLVDPRPCGGGPRLVFVLYLTLLVPAGVV